MNWLEMSQDATHGGGEWGFGKRLWSPTVRKGIGGRWGYWELVSRVRAGDVIFHLRGKGPSAQFVGTSVADGDAFTTRERPPEPGEWAYAEEFYVVPLVGFTQFEQPLPLREVFAARRDDLTRYLRAHSPSSAPEGRYLFYTVQSNRLQCQNGGYLTQFDEELARVVFGPIAANAGKDATGNAFQVIETASLDAKTKRRVGQKFFSDAIKASYGNQCCFPGCPIDDSLFLVGAHIARWADVPELRGRLDNGLCLCLFHDKAFECGLFSLDADFRIVLHPGRVIQNHWTAESLAPFRGQQLKTGNPMPAIEALRHHWSRCVFGKLDCLV